MAIHSSILTWRIPMEIGAWQDTVHGVTESDMTEEGLLFLHGLESNPGSSLQTEEEAGLP